MLYRQNETRQTLKPMTKKCKGCEQEKPLEEFHRNALTRDGRLTYCGKCCTERHRDAKRKRYQERDRTPAEREAERKRSQDPARRQKLQEHKKQYDQAHPEKKRAWMLVAYAIKQGRLQRQPCEVCGANAEAHHEDYSKPLDVLWLCGQHHREAHRQQRRAA